MSSDTKKHLSSRKVVVALIATASISVLLWTVVQRTKLGNFLAQLEARPSKTSTSKILPDSKIPNFDDLKDWSANDWNTYIDKTEGYSFRYPKTWVISIDGVGRPKRISIRPPEDTNEQNPTLIQVDVVDTSNQQSQMILEDIVSEKTRQYLDYRRRGVVVGIEVNGDPAYEISGFSIVPSTDLVINHKGKIYSIGYSTTDSGNPERDRILRKIFDSVVSSLKL